MLNAKLTRSFLISSPFQNWARTLSRAPFTHISVATGLVLSNNSAHITFMKSQWAVEPHNKHHTLTRVSQRCKVLRLILTSLQRQLLPNFLVTHLLTGTNINDQSTTAKKSKLQRLNFILVANLHELETFTIGRQKLLITPCRSVTSCSHWASCLRKLVMISLIAHLL